MGKVSRSSPELFDLFSCRASFFGAKEKQLSSKGCQIGSGQKE
jgi:hypothetical protein